MDGKNVMSEISEVNNDYPNNFESVKAAKVSFLSVYVNNHPHRLPFMKITGLVDYEFDSRSHPTNLTASHETISMDFSALPYWTRIYEEELPVIQAGMPGQGEFTLTHSDTYFWRFEPEEGSQNAQVKVGEEITISYERADPADEWDEVSSTTTDIMMDWVPNILYGGGDPTSGGKGADDEANSVSISNIIYSSGFFVPNGTIYRLPWEDPWSNETAVFADSLADYIAEGNAANPGFWSGSTTMALEFS
jgi:hypothetical protein